MELCFFWFNDQTTLLYIPHTSTSSVMQIYSYKRKIYFSISNFIQNMDFIISKNEEQVVVKDFLSCDRHVFSPGPASRFSS